MRTAFLVAALVSSASAATGQEPPVDFDGKAKAYFEESLKDPMTAVIRRSTDPRAYVLRSGGGLFGPKRREEQGYVVCYKVNAKNSYGGYTGFQTHMLIFVGGEIRGDRVSPYFNEYAGRDLEDAEVAFQCGGQQLPSG